MLKSCFTLMRSFHLWVRVSQYGLVSQRSTGSQVWRPPEVRRRSYFVISIVSVYKYWLNDKKSEYFVGYRFTSGRLGQRDIDSKGTSISIAGVATLPACYTVSSRSLLLACCLMVGFKFAFLGTTLLIWGRIRWNPLFIRSVFVRAKIWII